MENIDVIIPAYNEEGRISNIIKTLQSCKKISSIIVVDDGSTDNTYLEAKRLKVDKLISHPENKGKGAALTTGVKHVESNPFLIVDADLKNFTTDHINQLVSKYKNNILVSGVLDRGDISGITKNLEGLIAGVRLMDKKIWEKVEKEKLKDGYEIDYLIYEKAKKMGRVKTITLPNLDQYKKTEKISPIKGFYAHVKMFIQIIYNTLKRKAK
ncbi:MAG: glycosyltransferase family 2 protein [Patescibacteria group bacterium]